MVVIGVTGGVGTGKSTVARMFRRRGAAVLDADRVAHELMRPGTAVTRRIRSRFGREVLTARGEVDRRRLGALVFGSRSRLKALTRIVHPAVRREIGRRVQRIRRRDPDAVVVLDIPLLFESGHYRPDAVVVVTAPLRAAARRLERRSGWSLREVKRRSSFQMPLREKAGRADFVVHNGESLAETRRQVAEIWRLIFGLSRPV
ncbi:MAG: dephospho-CoA kinase [Candidatus Omnitrophica bacterium]|nr:dephospho-CoA kinase [Candidatus Omnitrophota bacterium]